MKIKRAVMYDLAPQMKTYYKYTHQWRPFIMYSNPSNLRTKFLNTDGLGLRFNNLISKKNNQSIFDRADKKKIGLIFGGSVSFGLGSSSDAATISSKLSDSTNITFYNLGVSGFSGFQETILHHSLIDKISKSNNIFIISGINDIFLLEYINNFDENFGPFFYSSQFNKGLENVLLNKKRKFAKYLLSPFVSNQIDWLHVTEKELFNVLIKKKKYFLKKKDSKEKLFKKYLIRNLMYWSNIKKTYNSNIVYVLQPCVYWTEKKLTDEENKIFRELDSNNERVFNVINSLEKLYPKYLKILKDCCKKADINFIDSNVYLKKEFKTKNDWCFLDRVHLNDRGNEYLTKLLKSIVIQK